MKATDILKHEHKIILLVLGGAKREAQTIQDTGKLNAEKLEKMVDFCRNFIDRCHHAKEEEYLFEKLTDKGMSKTQGPIAVMLDEHERGRQRIKAIAEALPRAESGDRRAIEEVSVNLCAYLELLKNHIDKENNILFPMADQLFTPEDQQALVEAFEKHEAEEMGAGVHEKYHQLAHELA